MANYTEITEATAASLEMPLMWRLGHGVFVHDESPIIRRTIVACTGDTYNIALIGSPMYCKVKTAGGYAYDWNGSEGTRVGTPERVIPGPGQWPSSDWSPPAA